ncbi:MAG: hypothetical protein KDH96_08880, partial [Candidatus Riesia sp.]|nr:hypothetical protein [Candidatus Riesia sp.]
NGSLVVCDEFHSTYNRESLNSRGLSLIYILNKAKNVRMIGTDATPIMSKPEQLVSVLNLFVQNEYFTIDEFFNNGKFIHDKKKYLYQLMSGRVAAIKNMNLSIFPTISLEGEMLDYIDKNGNTKKITELNFIKAPIIGFQRKMMDEVKYKDSLVVSTIALPNDNNELVLNESEMSSSKKYKYNVNIQIMGNDKQFKIMSGSFFDHNNIGEYSSIYKTMLDIVFKIKLDGRDGSKIIIMDQDIEFPGVNIIETILLENGFITLDDKPNQNTLCYCCMSALKNHKGRPHDYYPARIAVLHTYIIEKDFSRILEDFNSEENINGKYLNVLIGSSKIGVGIDFNSVQHIIITKIPPSINDLRQRIGRGARSNSMAMLPPENRHLHVYILCSHIDGRNTPDIIKWNEIINDKHNINEIDEILLSGSLTLPFYKKNFRDNIFIYIKPRMFNKGISSDPKIISEFLSPSFKKPAFQLPPTDTSLSDGLRHNIYEQDLMFMINLIKLFMIKFNICSIDRLWNEIQNSPIAIGINTKYINREVFNIALKHLINDVTYKSIKDVIQDPDIDIEFKKENTITDPFIKYFIIDNFIKRLILIDNMLILLSINVQDTPILSIPYVYGTTIQYKFYPVNLITTLRDSSDNRELTLLKNIKEILDINDIYDLFQNFTTNVHINIIKQLLEKRIKKKGDITKTQEQYLKFLYDMEYIFTYEELLKNKIVIRIMETESIKDKKNFGCIVAYNSVFVYKPKEDSWTEIDIKSSPRNNYRPYIIIGIFEHINELSYENTFKIKKQSESFRDRRREPRGVVCNTIKKKFILDFVSGTVFEKMITKNMHLKDICKKLRNMLFEYEFNTRTSKKNNLQYIY